MPDTRSPTPGAVARFFDNYLSCLHKASIPEKQKRWYVKRVEAFIKTYSGRKIKSLTGREVHAYLDMLGGKNRRNGWQFARLPGGGPGLLEKLVQAA